MRILICLALAAALSAPAAAQTRNFGVSGFDRMRVDGPFRVTLTTGVAPFARASGSTAALDRVSIAMQGRTLVVKADRSAWGGFPGADAGPVEISIGTHDLLSAQVNGSGSLAIDKLAGPSFELGVQGSGAASVGELRVDALKVGIAGSGSARLAGSAASLSAVIRGLSTLDAAALEAKDATIGAEGAATNSSHVTGTAKIEAQGPTAITLGGTPACISRLAGSSSVTGCRVSGGMFGR